MNYKKRIEVLDELYGKIGTALVGGYFDGKGLDDEDMGFAKEMLREMKFTPEEVETLFVHMLISRCLAIILEKLQAIDKDIISSITN